MICTLNKPAKFVLTVTEEHSSMNLTLCKMRLEWKWNIWIHTLASFGVQPSEANLILSSLIPVILSVSLASNAAHILKPTVLD